MVSAHRRVRLATPALPHKKTREPTSRDDCDSLSLAQVLSRWISGAGQLVAKHLNVLVLSRVGIKRLAEDILCRAQCG